MLDAVIFDLDGVLLDSEQLWDEARRTVVSSHGGQWCSDATAAMQGMSSPEWSRFMHEELGLPLEPARINDLVVEDLLSRYERALPLIPGAMAAVGRVGERWPLGLASSANRLVIDRVLALAGLGSAFGAVVSSEEVARGKPAPDVYIEAARRLGCPAPACLAVEDSENGIRSADAAGLHVVVVPNPHFPPSAKALAAAELVCASLDELCVERLEGLGASGPQRFD